MIKLKKNKFIVNNYLYLKKWLLNKKIKKEIVDTMEMNLFI